MSLRRTSLSILGFGVAALTLLAATQLLLLSFEADPLLSQDNLDSISRWLSDRPRPGPGILGGVALLVLALWLLWSIVRSFGTDRRVITTRNRAGWTKLDRATLEDALERELQALDRRSDLTLRINKRGRVDASILTPDPSATGPANELRDAIEEVCEARSLPCRPGRITISVPRRQTARRRVR